MTVPETKIYPRKGDNTIVYLKNVVKNPAIEVGDYTFYSDRRPALHNCRRRPRKTHPQALFGRKNIRSSAIGMVESCARRNRKPHSVHTTRRPLRPADKNVKCGTNNTAHF